MKYSTSPFAVLNSNITDRSPSHHTKYAKRPLCLLVSLLMTQVALAETATQSTASKDYVPSTQVDTIVVTAGAEAANKTSKTVVTSKNIQDNQIQSQQDLVRYNPEVSVAEVGRYGAKGFAIRGVDGNRVAMSYDGVTLPDAETNMIYAPYGYMYEGRFSPDTELLADVSLQVGADSFTSGSGAVGGSVNYKSKEPRDFIKSGEQIGGYAKTGYTSKNEEFMSAVGVAGSTDKVEALVNYVYREGHELKNHHMVKFNEDKLDPAYDFADELKGTKGILPDPQHYEKHAVLGKVYFQPSEDHRIGIHGSYQYGLNHNQSITKTALSGQRRIGYDESELTSYGVNYRYLPFESELIDEIKVDATHQEIVGVAHTRTFRYEDSSDPHVDTNEYNIKYRPQYDTTNQIKVEGYLLPIDTDRLGSHQLSVIANYVQTDYEPFALEWSINENKNSQSFFTSFTSPNVKKDIYNIAIADSIAVNDAFDIDLGLRYDDYTYDPYVTDRDAKDLQNFSKDYYVRKLYDNGDFEKDVHVSNVGWKAAVNYQLNPNWQIGYKAATGFMAPTSSQLYSVFHGFGNTLLANVNLKPEKSLNHELTLRGDFDTFSLVTTGFYTDYTNFIDTVSYQKDVTTSYQQWDPKLGKYVTKYSTKPEGFIESKNIDSAKTYGVRLGGAWDVSNLAQINGKLKLTGDINYAKDSTSEGTNLLSTQPLTGVLGIDYLAADEDYQLHAKLRYLGAKRPEDTKIVRREFQGVKQKDKVFIGPYDKIDVSKSAFVYDLYGSKNFGDNLILSAGIYNVFDTKYIPWSNLRTLVATSNLNSTVDKEGRGIERYTAPGRNYAVSLTYEF